jgi:hypothetical protein
VLYIIKNYLSIFVIIFIVVLAGFSGCNNKSSIEDKFIGTWQSSEGNVTSTMRFYSNGTVSVSLLGEVVYGTWEIKDGKLFTENENSGINTFDYSFSEDGKTLSTHKSDSGYLIYWTKQ